jgi:hypothetical protein
VALGGLAVQAALVNTGNDNVPSAPLGATPPAQLAEFDQAGVATGAPPLQVKSA